MIKAHAVPVPCDSVLAPLYVGADLLDAFAIYLPAGANDDLEVLARAGFERPAGGFRALSAGARCGDGDGRRQIVSCDRCCRGGAGAGDCYFPLLSKSAGELVLGEDDRISTSELRSCCARARRAAGS